VKTTTHQVEYRAISELNELEGNPRTIKKDDFERLKKSLQDNQDYFEARPLILSDRTGKLVIIAGNQRYKAAKAIGMTEVPTVLLSGLTEEREREIVIRDNVENGEWDMDILANEWDTTDLKEWGAEINWNEQNIADNDEIELDELSDEMELKIKLSSEDYRKVVDALRDIDENLSEAIKKVLNV
jgi:ParB-like chromosome segregation protein Spo0J